MSDKKRDLVLVTATFPFGYGETFLESEILILSQCFRKIYLLPLATTNYSFSRVLPQNCIVKKVSSEYRKSKLRHLVYLLSSLWFYRQLFCRLADFKNTFHSGLNISKQYFRLRDIVKDIGSENLTLYSYWFNLPSFALVQLKNLSNVSKVIVRTHRFDLYEEISRLGYHPFKKSFISKFDKIVSISNDGIDYLRNKYTDVDEAKFVVSKLGVQSQAHKDYTFGKELLLVSCSGIRPVKNVTIAVKHMDA